MSEIRELLSQAQKAEAGGKKPEAARLLRQAAAYYRDRQMLKRAGQMLRQARRVEGTDEEAVDTVFGFGVDFESSALESDLVLGQNEGQRSAALPKAPSFELESQRRARVRLSRGRPRLALVIGPEGTGKSFWAQSLGDETDLRLMEISRPLTAEEEEELLRWLTAVARSAFLIVKAPVPAPTLVLEGELGPEPLYDTASLIKAVPQLSHRVLSAVDAVIPFESPLPQELAELALALSLARQASIPESVAKALVEVALRAQRGAHEVAAMVARIPPGKYQR